VIDFSALAMALLAFVVVYYMVLGVAYALGGPRG